MKLIKIASGKKKLKLSRLEWESLGQKAGWIKKAQAEKVYQDGDRTLTLSGHLVLDPNMKYDATIRDKFNDVESVLTNASLSDIYLWAKEHNFEMTNEIDDEQGSNIVFRGTAKDSLGFSYADFDIDDKHWRYILSPPDADKLEFIVKKAGPYKGIAYAHKNKKAEFQIDDQFKPIKGTYKEF